MKSNNIKDIFRADLIGYFLEVIDSTNKDNIGIVGEIIDETKNLFVVKTEKGIKKLVKNQCKFLFYLLNNYVVLVDGKILTKRPWERLKVKILK